MSWELFPVVAKRANVFAEWISKSSTFHVFSSPAYLPSLRRCCAAAHVSLSARFSGGYFENNGERQTLEHFFYANHFSNFEVVKIIDADDLDEASVKISPLLHQLSSRDALLLVAVGFVARRTLKSFIFHFSEIDAYDFIAERSNEREQKKLQWLSSNFPVDIKKKCTHNLFIGMCFGYILTRLMTNGSPMWLNSYLLFALLNFQRLGNCKFMNLEHWNCWKRDSYNTSDDPMIFNELETPTCANDALAYVMGLRWPRHREQLPFFVLEACEFFVEKRRWVNKKFILKQMIWKLSTLHSIFDDRWCGKNERRQSRWLQKYPLKFREKCFRISNQSQWCVERMEEIQYKTLFFFNVLHSKFQYWLTAFSISLIFMFTVWSNASSLLWTTCRLTARWFSTYVMQKKGKFKAQNSQCLHLTIACALFIFFKSSIYSEPKSHVDELCTLLNS